MLAHNSEQPRRIPAHKRHRHCLLHQGNELKGMPVLGDRKRGAKVIFLHAPKQTPSLNQPHKIVKFSLTQSTLNYYLFFLPKALK